MPSVAHPTSEAPASHVVLAPTGLLQGPVAEGAIQRGQARLLAGGPIAFSAMTVWWRPTTESPWQETTTGLDGLLRWADSQGEAIRTATTDTLERMTAPRPPFAGLSMDRPQVMGILNCTPDSFSDGGDYNTPEAALARGLAMLDAGADLLDVGGESTRPGSDPVPVEEEIRRVVPLIQALAERDVTVSVDTRHAAVMEAALAHGAAILNDVTALTGDADSLAVAARHQAPVILMHIRGEPRTMQAAPPHYDRAIADVTAWLAARIQDCSAAGLSRDRLCVDPGLGFGKALDHNLDLLGHIGALHGLGCPVLLGASRKSFIAHLAEREDGPPPLPPKARVAGSLAAVLTSVNQGVQIVRVHDVPDTVQAIQVTRAALASG